MIFQANPCNLSISNGKICNFIHITTLDEQITTLLSVTPGICVTTRIRSSALDVSFIYSLFFFILNQKFKDQLLLLTIKCKKPESMIKFAFIVVHPQVLDREFH